VINVLIADDHAVVRKGLKQILGESSDMMVGGEAADASEALSKVRSGTWDVLVLDLRLPGRNGVDTLKDVHRSCPSLPVLVFSMHAEEQYALRVLRAGASGYLTKESAPDELVRAIRKVASGGKYVNPRVVELWAENLGAADPAPAHTALSDREFQVLRGIASGRTPGEIARELSLSVKTVSTYRSRILDKLHLTSTAQVMHYALEHSLAD
jgi:DNA-binding NarL/FixJ family response regulator